MPRGQVNDIMKYDVRSLKEEGLIFFALRVTYQLFILFNSLPMARSSEMVGSMML